MYVSLSLEVKILYHNHQPSLSVLLLGKIDNTSRRQVIVNENKRSSIRAGKKRE